ncbi:MAG: oligoendopeptidase F [Melioribacteraceae bacterium]|nr:oligoendopeptidase F [Melioribacteraceae bacterium]
MKKLFLCLLLTSVSLSTISAQSNFKNRDDIPDAYKWDLNDIYPDWNAWEKGLAELEQKMDKIVTYKGKLKESAENLLAVQKLNDDLGLLSYKVYRYPQLTMDLDTRNQDAGAKLQQVQIAFSKFGTATSWINPEMLEIPWETMKLWLDENNGFEPYRFGIEDLYRQQTHVLSEDKEKLISYYSQFNGSPSDVYTSITAADVDFPTVTLSDSSEVKATNGNYSKTLATNQNQEDRKIIYEAHYGNFKKSHNTYASIYKAVCQKDWAGAQARNYSSSLEAALEGNNIPTSVYETLVTTVRENTKPLQKYHQLRKRLLGLEKYYSYDGSIPVVDFNKTYNYETAKKWALESVKPLGEDYISKYKNAIQNGWVDVFETEGKRSGAYSANVYGIHPYMLMNYNETINNVFTLAHELGHTMHTLLANENQPFSTSGYTIFVAEVASTFNEALLLDYLLEITTDPVERVALLQQAITAITGTFYFQTLLADFELQVHNLVEQGKPVTSETLVKIMDDLFVAHYGDVQEKDEFLSYVWTRIPHIYRSPFYVYQYATCFASSAQIYKEYKSADGEEREKVIARYLNMLKSGGSDYPMSLLKNAGVDLSNPETIKAVVEQMERYVDLLEVEVDKLKG